MKKLLSLMLAVLMIASMVALLPVFESAAEESVDYNDGTWTAISTVDQFLAMANNGKYYLANDLDFDGATYKGYVYSGGNFSGTFDGRGYSVLNVKMKGDDGTAIFGRNFKGTLRNVTFGTAEQPISAVGTTSGKDICIVTASLEGGDSYFENIKVYADITLEGATKDNTFRSAVFCGWSHNVKVKFNNCHVYGSIEGQPGAGFMVTNSNTKTNVTFTNCTNNAEIYCNTGRAEPVAGFYAATCWEGNGNHNVTLAFKNCTNNGEIRSGSANDKNSAGGFVCLRSNAIANVTMDRCINNGNVSASAGGVAGLVALRQDGSASTASSFTIKNCANYGTISNMGNDNQAVTAAGIIAVSKDMPCSIRVENSANFGDVTGSKGGAGGIMTSRMNGNTKQCNVTIIGCVNTGNVTAFDWRTGGIVGVPSEHAASTLEVRYCYNTGTITNKGSGGKAAGIVGEMNQSGSRENDATRIVTNCYNVGTIVHTAGSKTFSIAHAENSGNNSYFVSYNNFYTSEADAANGNMLTEVEGKTNTKVETSELLAKLTEVAIEESAVQFVADTYGIYGNTPVLSWQIVDSTKGDAFSEGSLEGNTVSTTGITGYVSSRQGMAEGTSDLRFILAVDLEAAKGYEYIDVTVEFCDAFGIVKSFTLTFEELSFYLTANAAGETYTAADGDALFGVVITDVPNGAWSYAVLSVAVSAESTMVGVATTQVLG